MKDAVLLGQWCRLIVGSLQQAGVRTVLVSPGSRSTPLLWALQDAADAAHSELRLRSILDERSAAYEAVAQAKASGEPVAVLCTSGTAAANYLPAVIEAAQSHTPLIVLTADRPAELQHCSAPQTIDQVKLYGSHAHYVDLGLPEATVAVLRAARRAIHAAVHRARSARQPVHFEVRFRKPLEPLPPTTAPELELQGSVTSLLAAGLAAPGLPRRVADAEALRPLRDALRGAPGVVVVAGPLQPQDAPSAETLSQFLEETAGCLWAESTSQLRHVTHGALRAQQAAHFPLWLEHASLPRGVVVIELGGAPTTSSYERMLARHPELRRFVLAPRGWPDPFSTAEAVILGELEASLLALLPAKRSELAAGFRLSCLRQDEALAHLLGDELGPMAPWGEATALAALWQALPPRLALALGNSLPLRELDLFTGASARDVLVTCQRGANGIDGSLALVLGTALGSRRPTVGLVGDLSALHDLTSLLNAGSVDVPVALVVLNNAGGRIFEQLPVRQLTAGRPERMAGWVMPHELRFSGVAQMMGLRHRELQDVDTLKAEVRQALSERGVTLLEVLVPEHSARDQALHLSGLVPSILAEPR